MADDGSRAGRRYADAQILAFVDGLHAPMDGGLWRAFAAPGVEGMPAIQVGASEGRFLSLLMGLIGAKRVVEVGTLAGFSAIHLARGLAEGGHLWTVEFSPKHAAVAQANLAAAGVADRVTVIEGAGLDVLPGLVAEGPFDAVFIDADKENYAEYGRFAAANLRPGGLLLADNAYYFGGLLGESAGAASVRALHEEARAAFDTVCVPTPDGLLLGIKRG
ncbi:MAG: class I SAM-dependent methyltransferase [Myxococcales bacterium]|nr:class I SAM-dependent methyltransferase [Myxococcales bacterium]